MKTKLACDTTVYEILGSRYEVPHGVDLSPTKKSIILAAVELFSRRGYADVSVRDIAAHANITAGALYNYINSKEDLWDMVMDQAAILYRLYFQELEDSVVKCNSFEEVVDIVLLEPSKMRNVSTLQCFTLVITEQYRDERARELFNELFLKFSIEKIASFFDDFTMRGLARPFDTYIAATKVMNLVLMNVIVSFSEHLGAQTPYKVDELFDSLKRTLLKEAGIVCA